MGWYKVKIRKTDKDFSEYIRRRDGRCVYRFKCYGEERDWKNLQTSHFQKRRKESVRFDPENCDASCKKCHYFIENHPEGQKTLEQFKLTQLGKIRYALLILRANKIVKKDDKMQSLVNRELLKSLTD